MFFESSNDISILNCVSKYSVPSCNEIASKFFFKEDDAFEELFNLSAYPEECKKDVHILAFCPKHAIIRRIDEE